MAGLAQQLFAVGQMVGQDGANFQYTGGGGSYHGQAPNPQSGGGGGSNAGLANAAGLMGQSMAGSKQEPGMDYSLKTAVQEDNPQYGLMGKPQEGLGAGMQYKPQPLQTQSPYALQNTQGLNYQQPSGWSTFFQ